MMTNPIDLSHKIDNIATEIRSLSLHGIRNGDIERGECLSILEHRANDLLLLCQCEKCQMKEDENVS